jgi:hypothetical protein
MPLGTTVPHPRPVVFDTAPQWKVDILAHPTRTVVITAIPSWNLVIPKRSLLSFRPQPAGLGPCLLSKPHPDSLVAGSGILRKKGLNQILDPTPLPHPKGLWNAQLNLQVF